MSARIFIRVFLSARSCAWRGCYRSHWPREAAFGVRSRVVLVGRGVLTAPGERVKYSTLFSRSRRAEDSAPYQGSHPKIRVPQISGGNPGRVGEHPSPAVGGPSRVGGTLERLGDTPARPGDAPARSGTPPAALGDTLAGRESRI